MYEEAEIRVNSPMDRNYVRRTRTLFIKLKSVFFYVFTPA